MINHYFREKFSLAYNYFSSLLEQVSLNNKKFPQALIFEGNDTLNQYLFTLELARNLNCKNQCDENCSCVDCKWIKSFTHPAINIVSQIHFKPEGDETKTVISVKQAKEIENQLALSSDYHRFFIFFSSKEKDYDPFELNDFVKLGYSSDINYSIEPLEYTTFHPKTPNALLKSIEEPPEKTTFVFLTNSKENILPTIVSRCFAFKLSTKSAKKGYFDIINIIKDYPNFNYSNALYVADSFVELTKGGVDCEDILVEFIEYLKDLMLKNLDNTILLAKIQNDINLVNKALKYYRAKIQDKNLFEGLMLEMARN